MSTRFLSLFVILCVIQTVVADKVYIPPNPAALDIKAQHSYLPIEDRTDLATELGNYVKSLSAQKQISVAAKFLAVALCLDPGNKTAVAIDSKLKRKVEIPPGDKVDAVALGKRLMGTAKEYLGSNNAAHKRFAGYLLHLAILAAPADRDVTFEYEMYRQTQGKIDWASVLGKPKETEEALPSPKSTPEETVVEKKEAPPKQPSAPLPKGTSTVNGLAVGFIKGEMFGSCSRIHATIQVNNKSDKGIIGGFDQSEIDEYMQKSLINATHVLHERNKEFSGTKMTISFDDKNPKGGDSGGVAFTLAGIQLLEGIKMDPKAAVTGGINKDGTTYSVGGISAKVLGALDKGMNRVAVPKSDERDLYDLLIQKSYKKMLHIHVYSISSIDEAIETVRDDQTIKRIEGEILFRKVKKHLLKKGKRGLTSGVYKALQAIQQKIPNSFSTRLLIEMYKKKVPYRLYSARMAITEIDKHFYFLRDPKKNITNVPKRQIQNARKAMHEVKPLLPPEVQKLYSYSEAILRSWESGIALYQRGVSRNHQGFRTLVDETHPRQAAAYNKERKRLFENDDFLKKYNE